MGHGHGRWLGSERDKTTLHRKNEVKRRVFQIPNTHLNQAIMDLWTAPLQ